MHCFSFMSMNFIGKFTYTLVFFELPFTINFFCFIKRHQVCPLNEKDVALLQVLPYLCKVAVSGYRVCTLCYLLSEDFN